MTETRSTPNILRMLKACLSLLLILSYTPLFAEPVKRLVIVGDSLTEGYGVAREEAYPALLEAKIKSSGKNWVVINAGISGSTSASAPSRVTWQMKQKPDLLLLALGANDGLRGLSSKETEKNLASAIEICQKNSVKVVLVGMKMPPNFGADYTKRYEKVFPDLAKHYHTPLVPFLLESVAGEKSLNQSDGLHPNAKGHAILADTVFKGIQKYL